MLRIRPRPDTLSSVAPSAAAAMPGAEIVRDFEDPYLELVRLLREASEIEHALLVQYLYAAYSLRPAYVALQGFGFANANDLIGVAVQEMQHLQKVNELLGDLGAAPNLVRQDFPYEPDIYPFAFDLEPLSRTTLAKYVFTEAPARAFDRDDPANSGPDAQAFLDLIDAELGGVRPNHLGSLYGTIIDRTDDVIAAQIPGLPDLSGWPGRLEQIRDEGEGPHFTFFKAVFLGQHPGFAGVADPWGLPRTDPAYPSTDIGTNPSAIVGHPQQIADETQRRIAWLSDLHYWLTLGLLDLGYRSGAPEAAGAAKAHMTRGLHRLGRHLATLGVGLPLDPLGMGYELGRDTASSVRTLRALTAEIETVTEQVRTALPADFPFTLTTTTRAALDAIVPAPAGGTGGGGAAGGGAATPPDLATAMDFWFTYDDHFLFHPPPEVLAAYGVIGGPDFPLDQFTATRQAGTYPAAFVAAVTPVRAGLVTLSTHQLAIVDQFFKDDAEGLQAAFEHFGYGDLVDDRRPPGNTVHMMDSSGPANPPIGYHRWHGVIRAMTELGVDAERWQAIGRLVALAWAVHAEAQPLQDRANPPLPLPRLTALRAHWLTRTPDELDAAFDRFPFPAPVV